MSASAGSADGEILTTGNLAHNQNTLLSTSGYSWGVDQAGKIQQGGCTEVQYIDFFTASLPINGFKFS